MIFERLSVSVHGLNIQKMTSRCGFMRPPPPPPKKRSMVEGRTVRPSTCVKIEVEGQVSMPTSAGGGGGWETHIIIFFTPSFTFCISIVITSHFDVTTFLYPILESVHILPDSNTLDRSNPHDNNLFRIQTSFF